MSSKMQLVGIHMTPLAQQREAMLADTSRLQEAFAADRINPRLLPAPRSPMTPVFADEAGKRFLMHSTPRGMVATPMPDSPEGDLLNRPEAGGFVPWSQLQGLAKDAPNLGYPSNSQLVEAAKKALLNGPANETEAGEKKSPKKPNPFVQVGQSMLQGLPNMIAGQLAEATQQAGSIAGGIKNIVDGNSFDLGKLGAGIAGQIAGMAASMGLNAMWAVDDESSTGEQVAHKVAESLVNDIAAELVKATFAGSFQGMGGNLANGTFAGKLWNGLGKASPAANNPALRMGDVDTTLSPILAGSGNVFIEGLPAAREGDAVGFLGPPMVYNGAKSVSMNSMPAGRAFGKDAPSETTVGIFLLGAARTFIGGPATENVPPKPEVPSTNKGGGVGGNTPSKAGVKKDPKTGSYESIPEKIDAEGGKPGTASPTETANNIEAIEKAIEDSPAHIAIVGGDHKGGASALVPPGEQGYDHVFVAYKDSDGNTMILEMQPTTDDVWGRNWGSPAAVPGSESAVASSYDYVHAVPVMSMDSQQAAAFVANMQATTGPGTTYSFWDMNVPSFMGEPGETCSSAIGTALEMSGITSSLSSHGDFNLVRPDEVVDYFESQNASLGK